MPTIQRGKKIGSRWGDIRRRSIVSLTSEKSFPTFPELGGKVLLGSGKYEVEGFYADVVKLLKDGQEFVIPSSALMHFNR